MSDNTLVDINIESKKVRYTKEHSDYAFKMIRPRSFPWWVFLLLLPFLLLIRCQNDLRVDCIETETGIPVTYQDVNLKYTEHFIVKNGRWFSSDEIDLVCKSDSLGTAVFDSLPSSVFSRVCCFLTKGHLSSTGKCYGAVDKQINVFLTRRTKLLFDPRREDLRIRVVDEETGDPLPDAVVIYDYFETGRQVQDSVSVDAAGVATIPAMRYCGKLSLLTGSCYGYHDDVRSDVPCSDLLLERDSTDLRLRPIKEKFTFFVRNSETREPIPGASCIVTLTSHGISKTTTSRNVHTSVDGKGMGVYENANIRSVVGITASKPNYKDGVLKDGPNGPWKVEEFIRQPDSVRTIWLDPLPYLQEFINVDSLSLRPIPGVKNEITVYHADGTTTMLVEISNSNGVFTISAKEDERVEVTSTKGNEYHTKHTSYPKFKDITDRTIMMKPVMVDFDFKTVYETDHSHLLSNCTLRVQGSISGMLSPSNSGNGQFTVRMRKAETLTIIASKTGFKTNSSKIRERTESWLSAGADRRVIPLDYDLPPCDVRQDSYSGLGRTVSSFNMGKMSGIAIVDVDFYSIGDWITVYDGNTTSGAIIHRREYITYKRAFSVNFNLGAVTVVVESTESGSSGNYTVRCPTK